MMKRIMVIGNIGAGKTTFSKALHDITKIKIYHLDKFFFKTRKEITPDEEWIEFVTDLSQKKIWIIDGNYPNTLLIRAERADTIFILDPPIVSCYLNIIKRNLWYLLMSFRKSRNDSPLFNFDLFEFGIYRRIWQFKSKRKKYYGEIFSMQKNIYHFKSLKETQQFILKLKNTFNDPK